MSVDQHPGTSAATAVDRYRARMSRARAYYYAAISALVIAVVVVAAIAWSHGEISHVTLKTAKHAAAPVALTTPSTTLTQAWQSADHTASGTPYWNGTVVTYDTHTVRGRDGRTGAVLWSYSRSDRTVCEAMQTYGVTVAIYYLHGNCNEVTTLDTQTGARKWTRTLDEDGKPLNGTPTVQITQYTIMLTTPKVIYAFDPGSGIDRWLYRQLGCTVNSALLGSAGALISQNCVNVKCDGLKFCGNGPQLLLRNGNDSRNDSDGQNPDRIIWNSVGDTSVPVAADQLIAAYDSGSSSLKILDSTKGAVLSTLPLSPPPVATTPVAHLATTRAELIQLGGSTYSVQLTGAALFWAASYPAVPTVTPTDGSQSALPDFNASVVAAPSADGIAVLDAGTGKPATDFPVGAPPAGSMVYPFGTGFVVAGPTTTVYR